MKLHIRVVELNRFLAVDAHLERTGKLELRDEMRAIARLANVVTVRQQEPLGLGHAVLCARDLIGEEPFLVMLGDDIIDAAVPAAHQLAESHARTGLGTIARMEVRPEETSAYGIAAGSPIDDRTIRIDRLVEKPKREPPSNLAVIGRYVLPPRVFDILEQVQPGVGGEIQLTDALAVLAREDGLAGYRFEGERYDAGDRLGYLKANVAYALKRPELRAAFTAWLREVVSDSRAAPSCWPPPPPSRPVRRPWPTFWRRRPSSSGWRGITGGSRGV